MSFLELIIAKHHELAQKLVEHLMLSFGALFLAILIGVPAGIWIMRSPKVKGMVLGVANIFQTVPSLALLALLIPVLGIGAKPTIVTLTIYALLPIIRNTFTGLSEVPEGSVQAAIGLGFKPRERLWRVEIPLAMPMIVAGIRTASAMTIGITTIAAFIGAGGLGDFITQGLALSNTQLILLGAIPSALLALVVDSIIATLEVVLTQRKRHKLFWLNKVISILAIVFFFGGVFLLAGVQALKNYESLSKNTIRIASKNFTEQYILSEMMAQLIEAKTNLKVERIFNLGNTSIVQKALLNDEIDLYPEYTGTAYMTVLHQNGLKKPDQIFEYVKKAYQKKFSLTWVSPFGFENNTRLLMRKSIAQQKHISTMSNLVPYNRQMTIAAPPEFIKRADGLPGLTKAYGLSFKSIMQIEPNLMYEAIGADQVNIIAGFTTDPRIQKFDLVTLEDDLYFYPAYQAAPVIRSEFLAKHPEVKPILLSLSGMISDITMRKLNYQVDIEKQTPATVAGTFLRKNGLIN